MKLYWDKEHTKPVGKVAFGKVLYGYQKSLELWIHNPSKYSLEEVNVVLDPPFHAQTEGSTIAPNGVLRVIITWKTSEMGEIKDDKEIEKLNTQIAIIGLRSIPISQS